MWKSMTFYIRYDNISLDFSEEKDDAMEKTVDKPDNLKESKSKKRRNRRKALKKLEAAGKESEIKQNEEENTELTGSEKRKETSRGVSNTSNETETVGNKVESQHDGKRKQTKKRKVEEAFEENGCKSEVPTDVTTEVTTEGKSRKKKHKTEKNKISDLTDSQTENIGDKMDNVDESNLDKSGEVGENIQTNEKRKKKNKNKKKNKDGQKLQLSEERLKAYGINPKKYKYMKKEELYQVKARKNTKQFS